jgi:hypothetical protein
MKHKKRLLALQRTVTEGFNTELGFLDRQAQRSDMTLFEELGLAKIFILLALFQNYQT